MLAAGARHVFLPRFNGAALLAAIQEHGVTSFIAGKPRRNCIAGIRACALAAASGDTGHKPGKHSHEPCHAAPPCIGPLLAVTAAGLGCRLMMQPFHPLVVALIPCLAAVPAMVADLLAAASAAGASALPSVARILVGGGGMPPALQRGLAALCPAATVHTAYGMTEGASSLTFHTLWGPAVGGSAAAPDGTQVAASSPAEPSVEDRQQGGPAGGVYVGRPPPGIELAVYQPPAGELQPLSEASGHGSGGGSSGGRILLSGEGEIVMRGPHVMLGYWDDEEATAAAQLPGGWLRTGDLGCLRQGGWRSRHCSACSLCLLQGMHSPMRRTSAPCSCLAGLAQAVGCSPSTWPRTTTLNADPPHDGVLLLACRPALAAGPSQGHDQERRGERARLGGARPLWAGKARICSTCATRYAVHTQPSPEPGGILADSPPPEPRPSLDATFPHFYSASAGGACAG